MLQEAKSAPITYKLDQNYIYVSYDETKLKDVQHPFIKNRVLGIDLNPNYIGWTIIDWNPDGQSYEVVDYGVYSNKILNDKWFALKKKKGKKHKNQQAYASNSNKRKHITNKRKHMVVEIAKDIIQTAIWHKCQMIAIEDLDMESSDKCRGKKFNSLCNNLWNRTLFVNNLQKRCNQHNVVLQKVKANYSSFIGNMFYRKENMPDMCLASLEIGRRAFEYYNQYISKEKEQIKGSVMFPGDKAFMSVQVITREVFGLENGCGDWKSLYKLLKKSKVMYRLSIDDFHLQFSNFLNSRSFIKTFRKQLNMNNIIHI